ncbi:hypothetical protein [Salinicola sp. CPA57]|uniref:hypothetical protein n=1 Tax=Salinicola sp. CPA57 TaxID=1949080 RepID=UPI000DA1886A|nr:hypothetical protein [Salinicola sp. CPA57]
MSSSSHTETHGQAQTRLCADGAQASNDPADQLFYLTGTNILLLVPREAMPEFNTEMTTLEALVEEQQRAMANLKQWQDRYIAYVHGSYYNEDERPHIEAAGGVGNRGSVGLQVQLAQSRLNQANAKLNEVVDSLTSLEDPSNNIVELVALQRRGCSASDAGFRMGYVRAEKISPDWERYPLSSSGHTDIVNTSGQVDWEALRGQLQELRSRLSGEKPWIDGWLALEDQEKELFHWSQATNRNLQIAGGDAPANEHQTGSAKVTLNNEAQLMRWAYGAGGISVNANPYQMSGSIKATGHAELMLAQAKSEIHCYEPPGGYIMAFQLPLRKSASEESTADAENAETAETNDDDKKSKPTQLIDLGMIRSHMIMVTEGGIGASIAAELNIDADLSRPGGRTVGTRGTLDSQTLPGMQRIDMSTKEEEDSDSGNQIRAFVGAEMSCTITGQIEWKNPEVDEFRPFGKLAPQGTVQAGAGLEGGLNITYERGKFKFMAKAGFCWGVGAKGKVSGEIDASLVAEFIKWVAYQLRHVNYRKLDFVGAQAFSTISNIIYLAITAEEQLEEALNKTYAEISLQAKEVYEKIDASVSKSLNRGALTSRINSDPDMLKYTTPEAKGALLYLLTDASLIDRADHRNYDLTYDDLIRAGILPSRKRAIIRVFEWVQSRAEFDCVMQRVTPAISAEDIPTGEKTARRKEGEKRVYEFLNAGENDRDSLFEGRFTTSDYDNDLRNIYNDLPGEAPKGGRLVRNRVEEYFTQVEERVAPGFYTPCNNTTEAICLPSHTNRTSIA